MNRLAPFCCLIAVLIGPLTLRADVKGVYRFKTRNIDYFVPKVLEGESTFTVIRREYISDSDLRIFSVSYSPHDWPKQMGYPHFSISIIRMVDSNAGAMTSKDYEVWLAKQLLGKGVTARVEELLLNGDTWWQVTYVDRNHKETFRRYMRVLDGDYYLSCAIGMVLNTIKTPSKNEVLDQAEAEAYWPLWNKALFDVAEGIVVSVERPIAK